MSRDFVVTSEGSLGRLGRWRMIRPCGVVMHDAPKRSLNLASIFTPVPRCRRAQCVTPMHNRLCSGHEGVGDHLKAAVRCIEPEPMHQSHTLSQALSFFLSPRRISQEPSLAVP